VKERGKKLLETILIGFLGGGLFFILRIPLPWILGAMSFSFIWQALSKRRVFLPEGIKEGSFILLGIHFGLSFTKETFQNIIVYFPAYILVILLFIGFCIALGWIVTKWVPIDKITSVFSCIPGGLMEMALASESLKGNPSLVAIFQTIRLISVLFFVPWSLTLIFTEHTGVVAEITRGTMTGEGTVWGWTFLIFPILIAYFLKDKIPAGLIIGALLGTGFLQLTPISLPGSLPNWIVYGSQLFVGAGLGKNILLEDLKKAGKYGLVYFFLSILMILGSFGFGTLFAYMTSLNLETALLSIAPGGLFEMVLTAQAIGGDSAVVSALQLIRVLFIVTCVPFLVKFIFSPKRRFFGKENN